MDIEFDIPKKCCLCKKPIKRGQDFYTLNLSHFTYDVEVCVNGYKELKECLYIHKKCLEEIKNEKH